MDTWKGIGLRICPGGVMGLHMRCTKRHQNWSKCTKVVSIAWQSKLFRFCHEWLMWSIFGLNGHLEVDRSPSKSCKGHGVALEVHQNEPKCTNIHPKGHHCKTDQKVLNLSPVTNIALHRRCTKTRNCYREGLNNTIQFQKRCCILMQLIHYPITPLWFALTSIPF